MLNIYITEESKRISEGWSCITPSLSSGGDLDCHVKGNGIFSNEKTFKDNILSIISKMLLSDSDTTNLLIISAHGSDHRKIERKGKGSGCIELNEKESLDLRWCQDYFKLLPDHLVVFLNMCQGAYPGPFQAFCKHSNVAPTVIAPIVKMLIEDLANFQQTLIDTLKRSSDDEDEILGQVNLFNSQIKIKGNYKDFPHAMWMCKRSGEASAPWGVMTYE